MAGGNGGRRGDDGAAGRAALQGFLNPALASLAFAVPAGWKNMNQIHPIILCGGTGMRLWPRSRKALPKPFLPLVGEQTLFAATLARCADRARFAPPIIVTGSVHHPHVAAQAGDVPGMRVVLEPEGKSTAAAIALAAALLPPDAIMLVCPSDHHIADVPAFHAAIAAGARLAGQGWLVALGIEATAPETGYGYILRGDPLDGGYRIRRFVEKPDLATARAFLDSGDYSWNGGIFMFQAGLFLDELARHRPPIAAGIQAAIAFGHERDAVFYPDPVSFAGIAAESVDYAVMEETDRAAMVPADMGWSDIGNWRALRDARAGDADGNSARGAVELLDCRNVLAETDGPRISIVGLDNIAVVVSGGEVLVTSMDGARKVGTLSGASRQ